MVVRLDFGMANKRKSIGKKKRFEVFARDEFTCRYCGKQPPEVQLVIDHIKPVIARRHDEVTEVLGE